MVCGMGGEGWWEGVGGGRGGVDGGRCERPGSETSSLDLDGRQSFPDILCKGHFSSTFFGSVDSRGTNTGGETGFVSLRREESGVNTVRRWGGKGRGGTDGSN